MDKVKKLQSFELGSEILLFLISLTGCILAFVLSSAPWYSRLVMYTVLSNIIICFNYLLILFLRIRKYDLDKLWVQIIKFINVTCITLTFIIFALFLTPVMIATKQGNPIDKINFICHFVTPPLAIAQYLIFNRKFDLKFKHVFTCLIIPILYLIFIEIRGPLVNYPHLELGGGLAKYPYFFFDPYFIGYFFEGGVKNIHFGIIPFIIVLISLMFGIGYLIYIIKRKINSAINKFESL